MPGLDLYLDIYLEVLLFIYLYQHCNVHVQTAQIVLSLVDATREVLVNEV